MAFFLKMLNITQLVESFVRQRPAIKESLKRGLINYSALTRYISKESSLSRKHFDAILIACRRLYAKLKKESVHDNAAIKILRQSKVEVKTKIIAVVVEKNIHYSALLSLEKEIKKQPEDIHVIEGSTAFTIITSDEFLPIIRKSFKNKIIKTNKGLVEIIIKSPREIEQTPGVVPYLYSLFGEHGINIMETMSCWTDTMLVIHNEDIAKAIELLNF